MERNGCIKYYVLLNQRIVFHKNKLDRTILGTFFLSQEFYSRRYCFWRDIKLMTLFLDQTNNRCFCLLQFSPCYGVIIFRFDLYLLTLNYGFNWYDDNVCSSERNTQQYRKFCHIQCPSRLGYTWLKLEQFRSKYRWEQRINESSLRL